MIPIFYGVWLNPLICEFYYIRLSWVVVFSVFKADDPCDCFEGDTNGLDLAFFTLRAASNSLLIEFWLDVLES